MDVGLLQIDPDCTYSTMGVLNVHDRHTECLLFTPVVAVLVEVQEVALSFVPEILLLFL